MCQSTSTKAIPQLSDSVALEKLYGVHAKKKKKREREKKERKKRKKTWTYIPGRDSNIKSGLDRRGNQNKSSCVRTW